MFIKRILPKYFFTPNATLGPFLFDMTFKDKPFEYSEMEYFKIPKSYGECVRFNDLSNKNP